MPLWQFFILSKLFWGLFFFSRFWQAQLTQFIAILSRLKPIAIIFWVIVSWVFAGKRKWITYQSVVNSPAWMRCDWVELITRSFDVNSFFPRQNRCIRVTPLTPSQSFLYLISHSASTYAYFCFFHSLWNSLKSFIFMIFKWFLPKHLNKVAWMCVCVCACLVAKCIWFPFYYFAEWEQVTGDGIDEQRLASCKMMILLCVIANDQGYCCCYLIELLMCSCMCSPKRIFGAQNVFKTKNALKTKQIKEFGLRIVDV